MHYLFLLGLCVCVCSANAQKMGGLCDTIVLKNKREILVNIDSLNDGIVYYRLCTKENGLTRTMPVAYIKTLKGSGDAVSSLTLDKEGKVIMNSSDLIGREWTFKHRKEGRMYTVPSSREATLHFKENKSKKRRKGYIVSLEKDSVLFSTKRYGLISVPKTAITEISIRKEMAGFGIATGVTWLIIGISTIGVLFFLLLWSLLFTGNAFSGKSEKSFNSGCLMAGIGAAIGIGILLMSMPKSIMAPFSDRWEIVEISAPPVSEEANEKQKP